MRPWLGFRDKEKKFIRRWQESVTSAQGGACTVWMLGAEHGCTGLEHWACDTNSGAG